MTNGTVTTISSFLSITAPRIYLFAVLFREQSCQTYVNNNKMANSEAASIHMFKFQARHSFQPNFCCLTTAILSTRKAQDSNPSKELPDSIQAREKSSQL